MGCKAGLLVCEECGGKGLDPRGAICERCIGLGAANCPFCGGSGWITYNYVPAALLSLVVMERSRGVLEVAGELLAQPAPTADTRPAPSRAALIRQLVRLNRLLGAFNNAIAVANLDDLGAVLGGTVGGAINGNVLANDTPGADGWNSPVITKITYNGQDYTDTDNDGDIVVETAAGTLTIYTKDVGANEAGDFGFASKAVEA